MTDLSEKEEMIRLAAIELVNLPPGAIKDGRQYARDVRVRFGLSYDERHQARLLSLRMDREKYANMARNSENPPYAQEIEVLLIDGVVLLEEIKVRGRYSIKKITGNHVP